MPRLVRVLVFMALLLPFAGLSATRSQAAEPERLTPEWIYGDEARDLTAFIRYAWLDDGRAVLYDGRLPEEERTLEQLDAKSGRRKPLVNREKALASLAEVHPTDDPPEKLDWPSSFGPNGRLALYTIDDDLFLLEFDSSTFLRVTRSDEEEKNARFSPDGLKLAFNRDNDLWVVDLDADDNGDRGFEQRRLTRDGSETLRNGSLSWVYWEELFGRRDVAYWWSPNSSSIAYLQFDDARVPVMKYVDFEPHTPRIIEQRYPKAGETNPTVRVGVIDLAEEKARTRWVDLGAFPHEYIPRVNWLPDGQRLAVTTLDRSQTTLDLFLAQASDGSVAHLMRETDDAWLTMHNDLRFLDDGERFLWRSEREGLAQLYLHGLDGRLARRITAGTYHVQPSGGRSGGAIAAIHESDGRVAFTALGDSSLERHLYTVGFEGDEVGKPKRLTREEGSHRILFSPDGSYYFDDFSSIDTPRSLHLHRADGERLHTLVEPDRSLIERFDLQTAEQFTVEAEDGFEMPAFFLKPRDFDPKKKYPVIVRVYGGPAAPTVRNSFNNRFTDHLLLDEGFLIFGVDNRTATNKNASLTRLMVRDLYHDSELADLLDAVRWLKGQPFVDADRVGITGWSGGGTFTLLAMTSSKEFRAGIAGAPVSAWYYYDTVYTERYMKRPIDNPEGYEATSNVERAKDLHGRLMLIYGTYDDNVHPQNTWAFTNELIEAGIVHDLMVYPMQKHGVRGKRRIHLDKKRLDFWKRHLRDAPGPSD